MVRHKICFVNHALNMLETLLVKCATNPLSIKAVAFGYHMRPQSLDLTDKNHSWPTQFSSSNYPCGWIIEHFKNGRLAVYENYCTIFSLYLIN